jgi:hypothetical protein
MSLPEEHRQAAEAALDAARRPVMSIEQAFRSAQVHALLAIEARLGQLVAACDARTDALVSR